MRRRLQRWLPDEHRLRSSRALRWLKPLLQRPWLWHLTRRRVANGAAVGVFFGLLIPMMQIVAAAAAALVLRANLPVAAAATLVSNPLTYVPIWVGAYETGNALLGIVALDEQALAVDSGDSGSRGWAQRVLGIGIPLMLGLTLFASVGAAIAWAAVHLAWIAAVVWRRRRRIDKRRHGSRASSPPA